MPHTVVIAPDSFKGSIPAAAAAAALTDGWRSVHPAARVRLLPMADGGEGTLDAFAAAVPGARRMPVTVTGPEATPVAASWLLLPPTAEAPGGVGVVELACASGIELLGDPPRLRPLDADTRGFGEAIAAALSHGVSRLVLGIGSSASTDGGMGMLAALGARFADAAGDEAATGGRGLGAIASADLTGLAPLPPAGVQVLSDVTNPLLGERGAAAVFGPQKGATPDDVRALEAALASYAALLPADPAAPGAGAAGGTGFGLLAWGARLVPGSTAVAELIGLGDAVADASVVVTGEGSYDGQSAAGKVPAHVAALAALAGVPVALVAGRIAGDADVSGFAASASLTELAGSPEAAMADPARWLREAGAALARRF
ncbi:glycerate kinase [Microbacterium thalassium]|uniref:Glycerate kinase n=1 Tax=Microbacterium thalassium TaxID=362649 RepID=A0A7X0KU79_9MICO|nr:glycerate kinase [Microbacterium thalassium]MBB6390885.1 glycerate kinase [Microbacterium thalassium]GLK25993.1 glycerate kinase [Microbacterium thalassium]